MNILSVQGLSCGYKNVPILHEVSLELEEGSTTCVVGANGAGKTTLLRALAGQITPSAGRVLYAGEDVTAKPPHTKAGEGIVLVPEGRQLFNSLTVRDNLRLGATPDRAHPRKEQNYEWVLELFPRLRERLNQRAGTLSGGEQQMVALGRGLMAQPRVLMLDEPSLGLAPVMVIAFYEVLARLKNAGITMLLVEQNVPLAMSVSAQAYVLTHGRVSLSGPAAQLSEMVEVQHAFLGV